MNGIMNTMSIHFALAKLVREKIYASGSATIVVSTVTLSPKRSELPIV